MNSKLPTIPFGIVAFSPVSLSVFSLVPHLLFDCSRVLEYAKIRTVLQSIFPTTFFEIAVYGTTKQKHYIATQFWVVTRHRHGISALVSQTSFLTETVGVVAKLTGHFARLLSPLFSGHLARFKM